MANLLKVVFLGLAGFALLVYLTAEEPKKNVVNSDVVNIVTFEHLPSLFELVGVKEKVSKEKLFDAQKETLIVVGNHDSLAVVKELPKHFNLSLPFVMVANISSAPWFVKKMFIPGKLEELNKDSKVPMIYDFDGAMVHTLNVVDNSKTKYFAFILSPEGIIKKIYDGSVKEGALDGSMNDEEKKTSLQPLIQLLQKK